ncbi:hypothetical protein [Brevundimonas sp.]|uniref:hypothetical protein n=1 Tax=Brevundimonas sp. TaxID=1871086 RepID=UPI002D538F37|nr:hypothetical protein [Brevundimonas sp.]HYD27291.1 hypothetical protein [Brevundimonas sp.]
MLIAALLMTGVVSGAPLGEPARDQGGDQDSVVATAPATPVALDATVGPVAPPVGGAAPSPQSTGQSTGPHGLDTDEQIARWLSARAPVETRSGDSEFWRDDREPHGEVSVGFGTGGYRDYGAAVSLPIGENGRLDISIRQVENGFPYRYGRGYGYGYEPYFDDGDYVFAGAPREGAAAEYEDRVARPDGPPWARLRPRPQPQAAE